MVTRDDLEQLVKNRGQEAVGAAASIHRRGCASGSDAHGYDISEIGRNKS